MKRSTLALTTAAAVVFLGGAAVGGYALTTNPEPTETPAAVSTVTPAPSAAPEATPEATPSGTSAPVSVEPPATNETPLTGENAYLYYAGEMVRGFGYEITDAELLTAGTFACEHLAAGEGKFDIRPIDGISDSMNAGVVDAAQEHLCD